MSRKQAILPESLEGPTLATMSTGEAAWTVPWAMWADRHRNCWLHPGYPLYTHPGGTAQMRVQLDEDGYHVWVPAGEHYAPQDRPGYYASDGTEWLPVAALHLDGA